MRWIRSWVAGELPKDRPYVVDDLERLPLANWDYTPLGAIDDDVIIIEWDMALEPSQVGRFEDRVRSTPHNPLVAPYLLHHVAPQPVWAHRYVFGDGSTNWINEWDQYCDYFAFGLVYLPRKLVREFLAAPSPRRGEPPYAPGGFSDGRFTDQTFSVWYDHHRTERLPTAVVWDVRPVHLHSKIAASERL